MGKQTKVVKVPVTILEQDETLRKIKFRALDRAMQEAQYLGNLAIRYLVAYNLTGIRKEVDEEGKAKPIDTVIYGILAKERRYLEAGTVATLGRNFAGKMFRSSNRDAWAGKKSIPTYRSPFIPFRHCGTKIVELVINGSKQFKIEPTGFGSVWIPDELAQEVSKTDDLILTKEQKKLFLVSTFSWKDAGAHEIVKRISIGEYSLSDSMIKTQLSELQTTH